MPHNEKLEGKVIDFKKRIIDIDFMYKTIKKAIIDEGYIFVEKKQEGKIDQYGEVANFEFLGNKEIDEFALSNLKIEVELKNMNEIKVKGKSMKKGDGQIKIGAVVEIDYKNKWGNDSLSEFFFKLYQRYLAKSKLEDKYYDVINDEDVVNIYNKIKKVLEFYV